MDIIYLSSSCSDQRFDRLREQGLKKLPQAQKYHRLMIEGLASNIDGQVYCISALPINREFSKQLRFAGEEEIIGNIHYIYNAFINFIGASQFSRYRSAKKSIKSLYKKSGELAIVCDVLNQSMAKAARKIGKKHRIPVVGIVTDVPGYTSGARRKSYSFLKRKIADFAEKKAKKSVSEYDAYLFLTEAMNDVVNKNARPYIVIEGQCDAQMQKVENLFSAKAEPKVLMYAGGIHKEFGIARMVNAFLRGGYDGWELHIYGDGNYQRELQEIAKTHSNVKYFGVRPNAEVVAKQLEATVLINPRLTDAEYVKYSFPSKTMECMASGTPLLTTRLPGMPKEYYDYVYFIDDETEEGMQKAFDAILSISAKEHHELGARAKQFILNEKNNVIQAKKLLDFIEKGKTLWKK